MPDASSAAERAELHHEELALFLAVHLGRLPAMLWAEHDHPALRPDAAPAELARFAEELSRRTGLSARTAHGGPARGGTAVAHLLVHQIAGGGDWRLEPPPSTPRTRPIHCRLRLGEVLYLAPHWSWTAHLTPTARFLLTALS